MIYFYTEIMIFTFYDAQCRLKYSLCVWNNELENCWKICALQLTKGEFQFTLTSFRECEIF